MKAMKKSEAKVYKERLLAIRARMRGDVSALATGELKLTNQTNEAWGTGRLFVWCTLSCSCSIVWPEKADSTASPDRG